MRNLTPLPPKWKKISKIFKRNFDYNKILCIFVSFERVWRQSCCPVWQNKAILDACAIWPWYWRSRSLKKCFLDRQGMSFYMSVMISEALSLKITEILSLENVQNSPIFGKMPPIQRNEIFSKYPFSMYCPRVEPMLFWKIWSPICYSYGTLVANFWKTCPLPRENDKKFHKTGDGTMFEIWCEARLFRKFWSNLEIPFVEKERKKKRKKRIRGKPNTAASPGR